MTKRTLLCSNCHFEVEMTPVEAIPERSLGLTRDLSPAHWSGAAACGGDYLSNSRASLVAQPVPFLLTSHLEK